MDIRTRVDNFMLLQLNEHIMYSLFSYFSDTEVYFILRKVCAKIKYLANNYVQLVGTFLLNNTGYCTCRSDDICMTKILRILIFLCKKSPFFPKVF